MLKSTLSKIAAGTIIFSSLACADNYTGLDVKNGKGIKGDQLRTENFVGNLKIDNLDVSEIIVKAEGSEDYLRNLIIEQDGDVLVIKHKDIYSPTLKNTADARIHVQLPRQAALQIGLTNADATICDRGGDTTINVDGAGSAKIAGVEGCFKSNINGSGDIHITKLNGNIETNIQGNGQLTVVGGKSDSVKANISGAGEVSHGGEVKDADLTISGAGNISIDRLTGKVNQNVSGQGKVNINSKA